MPDASWKTKRVTLTPTIGSNNCCMLLSKSNTTSVSVKSVRHCSLNRFEIRYTNLSMSEIARDELRFGRHVLDRPTTSWRRVT